MPISNSGAVISSFFDVDSPMSGKDIYNQGLVFLVGQVEKVYFVDDQSNISKKFVEYDVSVKDPHGGQNVYRNVRAMSSFFSTNDYEETIYEPNGFAFSGKLDSSNNFTNKNGAIVILGCLNGSKDRPFIIGSFPHTKVVGSKKIDGVRKSGEFRGFKWEINKDGDFTLQFNGAKKFDGKPANEKLSKTTIKIGKDGKLTTKTGHKITIENDQGKENIQILTSAKQMFQINDTKGSETIALVHKTGALFNIDKKGSVKIAAANGSYLYLNAVNGDVSLVQADGNVFSVGPQSTLGSSDGKRAFSVLNSKIQAISDSDIVLQAAGKLIVDGGGVILQDPIAKIKIQNGKVALGTPAVELLDLFSQTLSQLDSILSAIESLTVGTAVGPSSPPINVASFISAQTQVNLIKTQLTTIKGSI